MTSHFRIRLQLSQIAARQPRSRLNVGSRLAATGQNESVFTGLWAAEWVLAGRGFAGYKFIRSTPTVDPDGGAQTRAQATSHNDIEAPRQVPPRNADCFARLHRRTWSIGALEGDVDNAKSPATTLENLVNYDDVDKWSGTDPEDLLTFQNRSAHYRHRRSRRYQRPLTCLGFTSGRRANIH